MENITSVKAIKEYFQADGGREVSMNEIKALSSDERTALGQQAAKALGKNWVPA